VGERREVEHGRFDFKCKPGANYGITQLLYSDTIVVRPGEVDELTPQLTQVGAPVPIRPAERRAAEERPGE